METIEKTQMSSSTEAEIIRQIEALIHKLALGQATAADIQMLQDLQKTRVELMRPKPVAHLEDDFRRVA